MLTLLKPWSCTPTWLTCGAIRSSVRERAQLEPLPFAGGVELQNRRSELKALRPFRPPARDVSAADGEHRGAGAGRPCRLNRRNLRGGEGKQTVNMGREVLGTSGGVDVHHGLTLGLTSSLRRGGPTPRARAAPLGGAGVSFLGRPIICDSLDIHHDPAVGCAHLGLSDGPTPGHASSDAQGAWPARALDASGRRSSRRRPHVDSRLAVGHGLPVRGHSARGGRRVARRGARRADPPRRDRGAPQRVP